MFVQGLLDQIVQAIAQSDGDTLERLACGLASVQVMALVRIVGRPAQSPEAWLTVAQASREFGLRPRWFYRHVDCPWVSRPSPRVVRISRRRLTEYMEGQLAGADGRRIYRAGLQRRKAG